MAELAMANGSNPLGAQFRRAYAGFRERLGDADIAGAPAADAGPESAMSAARSMQASLLTLASELGRTVADGLADTDVGPAGALQYAYAALTDEILLRTAWRGRTAWQDHLLEVKLFQTNVAGERLFARIAASTSMDNPQLLYIADIYLQCLNLGFQGQYRDTEQGMEQLQQLRRKLFFFVYRRRPDLVNGPRLMTEAAAINLIVTPAAQRSLGQPLRWWWYVGVAVVPLLLLSAAMWWHVVSLLNPLLAQILIVK